MDAFELSARLSLDAKNFNNGMKRAESSFKSFGQKLVSTATKAMAAATAAVGAGFVALGKQAVQAYADNQQLVGGVETLFKDSAKTIQNYANQAYKTAGISANKYMQISTSFAASLVNSLGGDTKQAAELANTAIIDMGDNANKMGTDLTSIQNAYQGFAKQNYTMLDNLKLGYGGTKTEMERLLKTANEINRQHGLVSKYSIENFSDIVAAIHTVQDEMGITGTTAKEASTTISGSIGMVKAAWEDMLVAITNPEGNAQAYGKRGVSIEDEFNAVQKTSESGIKSATARLVESVKTMFANIMPAVRQFVSGFGEFLSEVAPMIGKELPALVAEFLPKFIDAGWELIKGLRTGIVEAAKNIEWPTWDDIQAGFTDAWEDIKQAIKDIDTAIPEIDLSFITDSLQWFEDHKDAVITAVTGIIGAFVATKISTFISSISPMKLIFAGIAAAILLVATNWDKIKGWIGRAWKTTVTWVQNAWDDVQNAFEAAGKWLGEKWDVVVNWANAAWDGVKGAFDTAGEWVGKTWNTTIKWIQEKWDIVSGAFTTAGEWVGKAWNTTVNWVQEKWDVISGAFTTAGEWVGKKWDTTVNWVQEKWDDLSNAFSELGNWVSEKAHNISVAFTSTVDDWLGNIKNWILSTGPIGEATLNFFADVAEWFKTILAWLTPGSEPEVKANFTATVAEWIGTIYNWAKNGISVAVNFFKGVGSTVNDIFNGEGNGGRSESLTGFGSGLGGARRGGSAPGAARNTVNYTHAAGAWNIPYDNYPALLHRDEIVLNSTRARKYRNGDSGSGLTASDIAQAVRGAVLDLSMELNNETVGRVVGDSTTRRVSGNMSKMSRRTRYGYGG